jgi:hypothetical protein
MAQITFHSATPDDQTAMAAMRKIVAPNKGRLRSAAARGPYDEIMNGVRAPEGVTYEEDTVGPRGTPQNRPVGDTSKPASCRPSSRTSLVLPQRLPFRQGFFCRLLSECSPM